MPALRYHYSDTIEDFLTRPSSEIIGELTLANVHDVNNETSMSWLEEIDLLKTSLVEYAGFGSLYFEYNIPRMGRRADVVIIIKGIVFILEFKTSEQKFTRVSEVQVWDYALDLKNFQQGSRDRIIVPILIAPKEKDRNCVIELVPFEDDVYKPLMTNASRLKESIDYVLENVQSPADFSKKANDEWAKSGYNPTPTIIEAAVALYEEHNVADITKHEGDVVQTAACINKIIDHCREHKRKAICFVTGVPGAGKTLIGLQTAIDQFNKGEKAVYLSGNFPLVEVLQEALTRDYVRRSKEDYKSGRTTEKPCTKAEAKSKVKAFIQMIHHYRDLYLEGTRVENGEIVPIPEYFASHNDKAYVPTEPVAIFDEAQRAWTKDELKRFMKEKKQISDFPYSEPEYLISCIDRRQDWGLIICLIGGGQEINKGEAGLKEWIESLNLSFKHWDIYMSDALVEKEYAEGDAVNMIKSKERLHIEHNLHLAVSMRSFRAEKVSLFVHQLLSLQKEDAAKTLSELKNYPIVLTRDLDKAKKWLRSHARGSERFGLLASSKAERLKAISINVRYQPDFVHWFLEDDTDIRSSNCLEDTLTEFKVQGLEIDWACVAWDADLRLNKAQTKWEHFQLRSGTKWQNINKKENQEYQINAYRVLLTRARQGMVIVVPEGNPEDQTRNPAYYNSIYEYLKNIGINILQ